MKANLNSSFYESLVDFLNSILVNCETISFKMLKLIFFLRTREEEGWDDHSYTNDANPFGDPNLTATFRYHSKFLFLIKQILNKLSVLLLLTHSQKKKKMSLSLVALKNNF